MDRSKRARPSPALMISVLALFVAFGGTAIAVKKAEKNSVVSSSIKNNQVKSPDISNKKGVKSKDIVDGEIKSGDIGDGEVKGADVDESSLGQVPSAASATNATNASTVGGLSVKKVDYSAAAGTAAQEILNFGGLKLTATCDGAAQLDLKATTTKNAAGIHTQGIESTGSAAVGSIGISAPFFTGADELDIDAFVGSGTGDDESAYIQYQAADGAVVIANLVLYETGGGGDCTVDGIAIGG